MPLVAASSTPQSTRTIVITVAVVIGVLWLAYFFVSLRRNNRRAGGLTPTESHISRVHVVMIVGTLVVCFGLAIGTVLSDSVRDVLAEFGESAWWVRLAAVPLIFAYLAWLSRNMAKSSFERARREHAEQYGSWPTPPPPPGSHPR